MMDRDAAEARRQLRTLLADLEQTLGEERSALAEREVAALQAILDRKQALLDDLQAVSGRAQPERMARTDLPADELNDWQAIRDGLARCEQANQTNGAAVALGKQVADRLFNLLTGRSGATNVYDARGRLHLAGNPQQTREQV